MLDKKAIRANRNAAINKREKRELDSAEKSGIEFVPVEVRGEPVSVTILRNRR